MLHHPASRRRASLYAAVLRPALFARSMAPMVAWLSTGEHVTRQKQEVALNSRSACIAAGLAVRIVCTHVCHATETPAPVRRMSEIVLGQQRQAPSALTLPLGSALQRLPSLCQWCPQLELASDFRHWPCTSIGARTFEPFSPRVSRIQQAPFECSSSRLPPASFATRPLVTKLPSGPITTVIPRLCNSPTATSGLVTSATSKLTFTERHALSQEQVVKALVPTGVSTPQERRFPGRKLTPLSPLGCWLLSTAADDDGAIATTN